MRIQIPRSLFNIFRAMSGRKPLGYNSPFRLRTVLGAVAADGLEPDQAFALRGKFLAAGALETDIKTPGRYKAFFPGNEDGLAAAEAFAADLRGLARERGISAFGVAVLQGEVLTGPAMPGKPGGTIGRVANEAMLSAEAAAEAARGG